MPFLKLDGQVYKLQKRAIESGEFLRGLRFAGLSTAQESPGTEVQLQESPQRKLLKVAIVGRPNAGKSTLINSLLKLNLCGVSCKTHTTQSPFRAALTRGDTQIVLVDTPGLVTQKEYLRFNLSKTFLSWRKKVLEESDIIGVVHETYSRRHIFRFHLHLAQSVNDFPASKPLFLILSKTDLALEEDSLWKSPDSMLNLGLLEASVRKTPPKFWEKFSRVFITSALRGRGMEDVAEFLFQQAKPGDWLFKEGQIFERPLHLIIQDLLRAHLMNYLPHEIPYKCKYQVEYLKENDLGEILCVCVVTCKTTRYLRYITSGKNITLGALCRGLESDMYKILGRVFKIRVVVLHRG